MKITKTINNKVKIHLSWDNYEPDKMKKDPKDKWLFFLARMVPPGDLKFYFTVNGVEMLSNEMKVRDADEFDKITVPKTNIIENIIQSDQLITQTYLTNLKAIPRPKRRGQRPRPKSPWNISKSVFRNYQDDTEILVNRWFEFDWAASKIHKFIRNPEDKTKAKKFLKENYRAM